MRTKGRYTRRRAALLAAVWLWAAQSAGAEQVGDFQYTILGSGKYRTVKIDKYTGTGSAAYVPEEIDRMTVTAIGTNAFYDRERLGSVTIPASVTNIGDYAFNACPSLNSINVSGKNKVYSSKDGVLFNKKGNVLVVYPTGKTGDYVIPSSVTEIKVAAFSGCIKVTSIAIPASVTKIGNMAFSGCTWLERFIVAKQNPAYSSADGLLLNKRGTTLITFPAGKRGSYDIPYNITRIGNWAFHGCVWITGVTLHRGIISIGRFAFANCTRLTSLTVPEETDNVGDHAFQGAGLDEPSREAITARFGKKVF